MNQTCKKLISAALSVTLAVSGAISASACTGIYVGKDVSENGSTFIGRSEDIGDMFGKVYVTVPAKEHQAGEEFMDAKGFSTPYPAKTYAYNVVRDTYARNEAVLDENGNPIGEPYGAAGMNEKGVSISATVSTWYNKAASAADPRVKTGIREISIPSVVLGFAATAKEGVEILGKIIDEKGAGECNAIVIADAKEAWYMEILSGHQYAAVKMPADKVGINPNKILLGEIDVTDTENVIVSKNLVQLAKDNGFYQTGENGNIHVAMTYGDPTSLSSRYYQGVYYVNPEMADALAPSAEDPMDLFITPSKKLSTLEVLQYLAYRGEGSKMDTEKDDSVRPIGNTRQAECHVFEIRENMPAELATIEWLAMADAEFSVFVPFYAALLTEIDPYYQVDGKTFQENSINWNFQKINNLCNANRATCAESVKAYFEAYQEALIQQQKAIDEDMAKIYAQDPQLAQEKATALGKSLAQQVFAMSDSVLKEMEAYLAAGDFTAPFVPSAKTNNVLPKYNFEEIGGTGLVEPETENTTPNQNTGDTTIPDIPKTGGVSLAGMLLATSMLCSVAAVSLYKKEN